MPSPTSAGWQSLNEKLQIQKRLSEGEGPIFVTANEIKLIARREPRLMTKFDTRESRPGLLANATILPVSNGTYAVLPGDGYADVPSAKEYRSMPVPKLIRSLETLPWSTGPSSESQALDMAQATGILEDFLNDSVRLTIRGRLRSPRIEFFFDGGGRRIPVTAEGVQIEVDSGLEGERIHLVEAKLGTRTNFHIRQLFYPYRMWHTLVPTKQVSSIFLSWSNRCFSLRSFSFVDSENYHGLVPIAATDYFLDEPQPIPSLHELLSSSRVEAQPSGLPFPQADDFRRVIDVTDAVAVGISTREQLAARYDFDHRQADYYANAAAYLGFLERTGRSFCLTQTGAQFVARSRSGRLAVVLQQMCKLPVFRELLESAANGHTLPLREEVAELITRATGLSGQTPLRRALTVLSWTRWALSVETALTAIEHE